MNKVAFTPYTLQDIGNRSKTQEMPRLRMYAPDVVSDRDILTKEDADWLKKCERCRMIGIVWWLMWAVVIAGCTVLILLAPRVSANTVTNPNKTAKVISQHPNGSPAITEVRTPNASVPQIKPNANTSPHVGDPHSMMTYSVWRDPRSGMIGGPSLQRPLHVTTAAPRVIETQRVNLPPRNRMPLVGAPLLMHTCRIVVIRPPAAPPVAMAPPAPPTFITVPTPPAAVAPATDPMVITLLHQILNNQAQIMAKLNNPPAAMANPGCGGGNPNIIVVPADSGVGANPPTGAPSPAPIVVPVPTPSTPTPVPSVPHPPTPTPNPLPMVIPGGSAPPMVIPKGSAPPMTIPGGSAPPMVIPGGSAPPMTIPGGSAPPMSPATPAPNPTPGTAIPNPNDTVPISYQRYTVWVPQQRQYLNIYIPYRNTVSRPSTGITGATGTTPAQPRQGSTFTPARPSVPQPRR
jgi:hypothetical protein